MAARPEPNAGPDRIRKIDLAREYRAIRDEIEILSACDRAFDRMQLRAGDERHALETEMATFAPLTSGARSLRVVEVLERAARPSANGGTA